MRPIVTKMKRKDKFGDLKLGRGFIASLLEEGVCVFRCLCCNLWP